LFCKVSQNGIKAEEKIKHPKKLGELINPFISTAIYKNKAYTYRCS
jgi:hypothetical protein